MVFQDIGYVLRQMYSQADNYGLTVGEHTELSCSCYNKHNRIH